LNSRIEDPLAGTEEVVAIDEAEACHFKLATTIRVTYSGVGIRNKPLHDCPQTFDRSL
jgi:hypothetical protein